MKGETKYTAIGREREREREITLCTDPRISRVS
jgi:hypothetical protein